MKITKRQLRRIIKEEKRNILKEGYYNSLNINDIDTGDRYATSLKVEYDMVTIRFGNSFTLHLDSGSAQELAAAIQEAGLQLEDEAGGRNPGGSIG